MICLQKVPQTAIPPLPIQRDKIFKLDVDDDIWQDVGLEDESLQPPRWLADNHVWKGIRLVLELDRCEEEARRLMQERCVLQEWFMAEWLAVKRSLADADDDLRFHLECHRAYLSQLFLDLEGKVRHISWAWDMPSSWGPTPANIKRA
ncbi:hypothetical protein HYDPIDRAFT_57336, partial [Hydnomerulius pinastri MD-312]